MNKQASSHLPSLPSLPRIVTSVALAAPAEGHQPSLPTRMRILNWGDNPNSHDLRVCVGPQLVDALASPNYPFRQIALDYEHNTWPGSKAFAESREPREVAAFLTVDAVEGDGVYVNVDRWTPSGLQHAHNYCDLSATPLRDTQGNVTGIISVALSRTGAVPDIVFEQAAAAMNANPPNPQGATSMNWKEILAAELGLQPDCTDEELKAAWQAHLAAGKPAKKPDDLSDRKTDDPSVNKSATPPDKEDTAEAIAEVVATAVKAATAPLAERLDNQDKEKIIADARADGKVVTLSDSLRSQMSIADLRTHVESLPHVVPLAALTPVKINDQQTVTLSAIETQVCQSLGLSTEAYAKEKGASK